jgi:hypothetical protein
MRSLVIAAVVMSSVVVVGCGDDKGAAAGECRSFVEAYCARVTECALPDAATCASDTEEVFGSCDNAVKVSNKEKFDTCLTELKTHECTQLDPNVTPTPTVPENCRGQILF